RPVAAGAQAAEAREVKRGRLASACVARYPSSIATMPRAFAVRRSLFLLPLLLLSPVAALQDKLPAGKPDPKQGTKPAPSPAPSFAGLRLRSIGPGTYSGRVNRFAVHPRDRGHYYAAVASGGVWKTTNAGTTWSPVFDEQGPYSIGCIAL